MALTNEQVVWVLEDNPYVSQRNFRPLLKVEMVQHARTILYNENVDTYSALPLGRKELVDLAREIILNPETHLASFVSCYAKDSNVEWAILITKIPDVVPAIFPEVAGLIRKDRP